MWSVISPISIFHRLSSSLQRFVGHLRSKRASDKDWRLKVSMVVEKNKSISRIGSGYLPDLQ